jgi:hypothetical protein
MKTNTLSPQQAAWLAETFERNRARFGGMRMMAETKPDPDDKKTKPDETKPDDKQLGDGGLKALQDERDARKKAEQDLAALRGEFDGFKATLTEAFGVKPEKGADDNETLTTIQQELADMRSESEVLRLANEHKITDKNDLELLGSAKDSEARAKLAARLAAKADDKDDKKKPGPRPDLTQGPKGEEQQRESLPGVPRMAQALEDAINTN